MGGNKSLRNTIVATVLFLFGLYRLGSPYLEETESMKAEAEQIRLSVLAIQDEMAQYNKAWTDKMDKSERLVKEQLPDSLDPSQVLNYFISGFESTHPGRAAFLSVSTQPLSPFSLARAGEKSSEKENPRSARFKFEAQLSQDVIVEYMEHIEKYPGLLFLLDFNFHLEPKVENFLKMEMSLQFFLSPKEWTTPDTLASIEAAEKEKAKERGKNGGKAEAKANPTFEWRPIFLSSLNSDKPKAPVQAAKRMPAMRSMGRQKPLPVPSKIVGGNVVIDESLFEEGDKVGGWKIIQIDQGAKTVTFKSGSTTKTVVVK